MASIYEIPGQLKRIFLLLCSLVFCVTLFVSLTERIPLGSAVERAVRILLLESLSENPTIGEILIIFLGVIVLWFSVWTTLDLIIEGKIDGYYKEVKLMSKIVHMKDHVIICGAGRVGSQVAKRISDSKGKLVIIEMDEKTALSMKEKGFQVLNKNCLDEATLKLAGVEHAKAIAAALGQTEKNLYLALAAKEINPKIKVYARADDEKIAKKLRTLGVDYVVTPEVAGANAIADQILK